MKSRSHRLRRLCPRRPRLRIRAPGRRVPRDTPGEEESRRRPTGSPPSSSPSAMTSTAIPELGLDLPRTSAIVADYFRKLGLEVRTGYAKTGVIGILKGGEARPGRGHARRHGRLAHHRGDRPPLRFEGQDRSSKAAKPGSCTPAGTTSTRPCSSASPPSWRP